MAVALEVFDQEWSWREVGRGGGTMSKVMLDCWEMEEGVQGPRVTRVRGERREGRRFAKNLPLDPTSSFWAQARPPNQHNLTMIASIMVVGWCLTYLVFGLVEVGLPVWGVTQVTHV